MKSGITLRDYLHRLAGRELRAYTRADCQAATALWCNHLTRQERDGLVEFLLTRARRGRMTLAEALLRC